MVEAAADVEVVEVVVICKDCELVSSLHSTDVLFPFTRVSPFVASNHSVMHMCYEICSSFPN